MNWRDVYGVISVLKVGCIVCDSYCVLGISSYLLWLWIMGSGGRTTGVRRILWVVFV